MLSSTLEHATPEQMFTDATHRGEAVSAIRAIQKATQQGQRIYQLTAQNIATALPNIHHDSDTIAEIRNAVNAGKEVITHTDAIQVPGWSGAGYIIVDNETGAGAYKISGGGNESFLSGVLLASSILLLIGLFFASLGPVGLSAGLGLFAPVLAMVADMIGTALAAILVSNSEFDTMCFISGISYVLSIGAAAANPWYGIILVNAVNLVPGLPTAIDCF